MAQHRGSGPSGDGAIPAAGKRLLQGIAAAAIGLGLAACTPAPESAMDVVYLPGATPRISAPAQRSAQLRTGTYLDDIPEYTGAPGIDARWPAYVPRLRHPAYVPRTHTTVYKAERVRIERD